MSSNYVKFKFVKTDFNHCVEWGFLKVNSNNISEIIEQNPIIIAENISDEFYNFIFGKKIILIETIDSKEYYIKKMEKIIVEKMIMNNKNEYLIISV